MKRTTVLSLQLTLMAAIGLTAGCKFIPPKPAQFNSMMAKGNEKLAEAAKQFKEAVEKSDASAARSALNAADKAVTDLTKEFDSVNAPKHGAALLAKYRDFLKRQRQIVDECMKPAVAALEDNKVADKWGKIRPLLTKARDIEQEAFKALDAAQSEFCAQKEFNFERKD